MPSGGQAQRALHVPVLVARPGLHSLDVRSRFARVHQALCAAGLGSAASGPWLAAARKPPQKAHPCRRSLCLQTGHGPSHPSPCHNSTVDPNRGSGRGNSGKGGGKGKEKGGKYGKGGSGKGAWGKNSWKGSWDNGGKGKGKSNQHASQEGKGQQQAAQVPFQGYCGKCWDMTTNVPTALQK